MTIWLRRLVYLLLFFVWLLVMTFPVIAVVLATQGEIQVGDERAASHVRLFLVQEASQEGVGLDWSRPAVGTDSCRQGRIIYLMWEGSGEDARYCTCFDAADSVISSTQGACSSN